jgi:hypothetical protein
MSTNDPNVSTPPEQLARYRLLQKLGEGGMGAVWLAYDTKLDRHVALKLLPPQRLHDADAVARFRREAKALAQLSHPGIVQAYDSDAEGGQHFLVMEYVEGLSLARLLKEQGKLSPGLAADYVHQAALALQHAHEKGLVHRDLKPGNLLLTADGRVKLLDLGLARFLQDQLGDTALTLEGYGMGTPDYAAPEQFRDARRADVRSDVYALGCTLYHLLAGRVPFPGSSLSDKRRAHEQLEAAPLEELCPDAPVGLVLAVERMMAKRPKERFQSAREVAQALELFVASAGSLARLRNTTSWDRGQLTVDDHPASFRKRGAMAAAGLALLLAFVWLSWLAFFREPEASTGTPPLASGGKDAQPKANPGQPRPAGDAARGEPEPAPPDDPDVLTVAKNGKGRYDTIGKALADVKPGQTIRVLDDATYPETLFINHPERHAGITLEAPRHARIEKTITKGGIVSISRAPGVTVRGFRLRTGDSSCNLVMASGQVPGLVLEDLECEPGPTRLHTGIACADTALAEGEAPIVIRNCRVRGASGGIVLAGLLQPCRRVIIRDNRIEDCLQGITLTFAVQHAQVVGNRIVRADMSGIQFHHLAATSRDILLANNTVFGAKYALHVWDKAVKGKNVLLRNNLFLGSGESDMVFATGDLLAAMPTGVGEGKLVAQVWQFAHNWREVKSDSERGKDWIPPGKQDVLREQIAVLSRTPADANFLRPPKGSPLAAEGAGKTDPSLPPYVGAVLPEGVPAWDWDRTWRAPPPGRLLTVSKDPEDGGTYRTLNEALKAARPWTTIRVLDDATYTERIVLEDPKGQRGIVLEAPRHATLLKSATVPVALAIKGVADVRVRGFRFRASKATGQNTFLNVSGRSPGVVLEGLDLQAGTPMYGVTLKRLEVLPGEAPLVVRDCTIQVPLIGISVSGPMGGGRGEAPCSGIVLRQNRAWGGLRGIQLEGRLARVQVVGNLLWNASQAALQFQDLAPNAEQILIGNNTIFDSSILLRIWNDRPDDRFPQRHIELCNNLFFDASEGDLFFILGAKAGLGSASPERARDIVDSWQFHHNRRDWSGATSNASLPRATRDEALSNPRFISRDPSKPGFMRPTDDSPWAKHGAGQTDPSLPTYIGAVPPAGVEVWDWQRTWRSRAAQKSAAAK